MALCRIHVFETGGRRLIAVAGFLFGGGVTSRIFASGALTWVNDNGGCRGRGGESDLGSCRLNVRWKRNGAD